TLTLADLAVVGPMARTFEDLEHGLEILAGPNRWQKAAWRLELPPPRRKKLTDYRIAAWLDDPRCLVEPGVKALLENAARKLMDTGAALDTDARPDFSLEKGARRFSALPHAAFAGRTAAGR